MIFQDALFCDVLLVGIIIVRLIVVEEIHEDRAKLVAQSKISTDQLRAKIADDTIGLGVRITLIFAHMNCYPD